MRLPAGWSFERIALTVFALGAALMTFGHFLRDPPRVLPFKERKEIVARDRAFLEAPTPDRLDDVLELARQPSPIGPMAVIGDKCTGKDCQVVSITTSPVAFANLPTCNASSRAMARFTTNGAADGGGGYMTCDGTAWQQMGAGGSAGPTEELTASYPLSLYDDGGTVNISLSVPLGAGISIGTVTVDVANTATQECAADFAVTAMSSPLKAGTACTVSPVALSGIGGAAGMQFTAWASDTGSCSIRACCNGVAACDPASQLYTCVCFVPP